MHSIYRTNIPFSAVTISRIAGLTTKLATMHPPVLISCFHEESVYMIAFDAQVTKPEADRYAENIPSWVDDKTLQIQYLRQGRLPQYAGNAKKFSTNCEKQVACIPTARSAAQSTHPSDAMKATVMLLDTFAYYYCCSPIGVALEKIKQTCQSRTVWHQQYENQIAYRNKLIASNAILLGFLLELFKSNKCVLPHTLDLHAMWQQRITVAFMIENVMQAAPNDVVDDVNQLKAKQNTEIEIFWQYSNVGQQASVKNGIPTKLLYALFENDYVPVIDVDTDGSRTKISLCNFAVLQHEQERFKLVVRNVLWELGLERYVRAVRIAHVHAQQLLLNRFFEEKGDCVPMLPFFQRSAVNMPVQTTEEPSHITAPCISR